MRLNDQPKLGINRATELVVDHRASNVDVDASHM